MAIASTRSPNPVDIAYTVKNCGSNGSNSPIPAKPGRTESVIDIAELLNLFAQESITSDGSLTNATRSPSGPATVSHAKVKLSTKILPPI